MTKKNNIIIEMAMKYYENKLSNHDKKDAISILKEHYQLSEEEEKIIDDEIKEKSQFDNPELESIKDTNEDRILFFSSEEEMDDSIGRLMYNRVPWESQSNISNSIKFSTDEDLKKAIKVLSKFNFIKSENNIKATITFDNIEDYKKVYSYITKNDMFTIGNSELDFSYDKSDKDDFLAINKKNKSSFDPNIDTNISVRKIW